MTIGVARNFVEREDLPTVVAQLTRDMAGIGNNLLYNFSPANFRKFRAALAKTRRGTSNTKIACVGDSTTRGQGSGTTTAQALNGWPVQLSAQLASALGMTAGWQNLFGQGNATLTSFDSRVGMTGTFTTSSVSFGGNVFRMAAAATLAFTPTVNCDTFDVYSVNNGVGQFTINLDGGATLATVNTTADGAIVKTTVSGSLAGHTLNMVWVSGTPYILGCDCYATGTKQISVWNGGWLSSTSVNWASNVGNFNPSAALQNYLLPDLSIIDIGINDWIAVTDIPTYKAGLQTVISACLATGDVILKTPAPSQITVTDLATQRRYVQAMYDLAQANNVALVDGFYRFGSYEIANPLGFYTDNKHPTATGYADIAAALRSAILGVV